MTDILAEINEEQSTKNKIFMVAAKLMAEKGYNGVSMREISEQSGVSKPTLYYYFGNKEGIYKTLLEIGFDHIEEILKPIQQMQVPVKTKLINFVKVHFQECLAHPEFIKFILKLLNYLEEIPFLKTFDSRGHYYRRILSQMIEEGIKSGEFGPSTNPELAAEIIGSVLSHFFWHQIHCPDIILTDKLAEELIEFLFKGLNE